uniref:HIG1 domain-containing protein n=1 Tax=Elaeophora elaphi TaxID=1147741 RepID=A0A0R3RLT0_9BILA
MSSATIQKANYDPGLVGLNLQQQEMKRHREWLKNPLFLSGTLLAWIALMGYLKPHSERISLAEHRFRIFLQGSSFVFVLACATMARYYQQKKNH